MQMSARRRTARMAGFIIGSALTLSLAAHASDPAVVAGGSAKADPVLAGFENPPERARPRVWWHWMNGNITKDGIRKDLDWMSRIGIGGVQNFDAALQTPQIVNHRLVYMTPEWRDAFQYAVRLADRKGLEFAIASSPGWSETGGPWVPPRDGMKKLVWSDTVVEGGHSLTAPLPLPPSATGPFQDARPAPSFGGVPDGTRQPQYYADAEVIAYPVTGGAHTLAPKLAQGNGTALDADKLTDHSYRTFDSVPIGSKEHPSFVVADFGHPQEVRAMSLAFAGGGGMFGGGQPAVVLEKKDTDGSWSKLVDVPMGGPQTTVAFAPITVRRLRIALTAQPPFSLSFLGSVPGAVTDIFPAKTPTAVNIAEMRFSDAQRIDRFEDKAGFAVADNYYELKTSASPDATGIDPKQVIDLTSKLRPDGTLDWTPPPGHWRIVRFGYSLVGTTNHPATAEATGLEVDKYDSAAVKRYLDHYLAMMRGAAGPGMFGAHGIRALLTDSTEVGASNWTPSMIAQFRKLRGYDPRPWLPALTGAVVGTRAQSDRFLFDFRRTLADLMATQHYWQVAETAHANGLKVYGEALEAGRPVLGNELTMRAKTDVPMAALWTYDPKRGPRTELLGDMKGAASVAHVDGQNLVAAESLTAAFSPWAFAPVDLKPAIDLEFAYGINRPVIHTSVHQPVDDKLPGLSLGPFGQYFNRHETWANMAKPWIDYISRSSYLLQQGRYYADVAYFYGEDAPLTILYRKGPPKDAPTHYGFDFVSARMLRDTLQVADGDLVAPAGARFKILFLGGTSSRMTLPVLKRIAALAEAGATIVGTPPTSSPSLSDDAASYRALVSRLWSGQAVTRIGKGRVIASSDPEAALASIGVGPDFTADKGSHVLFLHRRTAQGDIYFLTNRDDHAARIDPRFRVAGKAPELWHADSGRHEPASYRIEGRDTVVPLTLEAHQAVFVVFRKPTSVQSRTVAQQGWTPLATLAGPWKVTFQPGRGAPVGTILSHLGPLSENPDPAIRYFSGTATYVKRFRLPGSLKPGAPLKLDLGKVGDVAQVYVNGKFAGTAWKPPYRVDIGPMVKPGSNTLEIRVADLWVNRLIGDAQPGAHKITFTTLPTYKPDAPLRPSGLMGPVALMRQP